MIPLHGAQRIDFDGTIDHRAAASPDPSRASAMETPDARMSENTSISTRMNENPVCQQYIIRLAGGYRIQDEACVIRACYHEMLAVTEFYQFAVPRHIRRPLQRGMPSSGNRIRRSWEWMPSAPIRISPFAANRSPDGGNKVRFDLAVCFVPGHKGSIDMNATGGSCFDGVSVSPWLEDAG
jgi:hypothetical protein